VRVGKQFDVDIFWRPCANFGRSPGGSHGFRVEFFVFRRSAISSARAVGGVEKGTKGKKGDAFTYIEVFKRLIASGDGDDAIIEGCIL